MSAPWIELTESPIVGEELVEAVQSPNAGAVVLFLGTVREMTGQAQTASLEYEAFGSLAVDEIRRIVDQAREAWPLEKVAVVHRVGHLEIGETAVGVAASSPHRKECFEATQMIMDQIKKTVPIWKKENWADGTSEWVHPGIEQQESTS